MPWSETTAMGERKNFIDDLLDGRYSMSELCGKYGIGRETGCKWIERFRLEGVQGLEDRSHAATVVHNRTNAGIEQALIAASHRYPTWGAAKLMYEVGRRHPQWTLPHESTVCGIFKRNGLVRPRVQRRAVGHPGRPQQERRQARVHQAVQGARIAAPCRCVSASNDLSDRSLTSA